MIKLMMNKHKSKMLRLEQNEIWSWKCGCHHNETHIFAHSTMQTSRHSWWTLSSSSRRRSASGKPPLLPNMLQAHYSGGVGRILSWLDAASLKFQEVHVAARLFSGKSHHLAVLHSLSLARLNFMVIHIQPNSQWPRASPRKFYDALLLETSSP